jgi:hypothetical protein
MTQFTPEQLAEMPVWHLDQMALPRGKFSPEEQAAARQEIKRRFGLPQIKMPPKEPPLPDASRLIRVPGGGWIWEQQESNDA